MGSTSSMVLTLALLVVMRVTLSSAARPLHADPGSSRIRGEHHIRYDNETSSDTDTDHYDVSSSYEGKTRFNYGGEYGSGTEWKHIGGGSGDHILAGCSGIEGGGGGGTEGNDNYGYGGAYGGGSWSGHWGQGCYGGGSDGGSNGGGGFCGGEGGGGYGP